MTTTKTRSHAKPPARLTATEQKRWKELLSELNRLQRGLDDLGRMRLVYARKEDFDLVARNNCRLAAQTEAKMIEIENVSAARIAAKAKEKAS